MSKIYTLLLIPRKSSLIDSFILDTRYNIIDPSNAVFKLDQKENTFDLTQATVKSKDSVEANIISNNINNSDGYSVFYTDIPKINPDKKVLFMPPLLGGSVIITEKDYENYRVYYDCRKFASLLYEGVYSVPHGQDKKTSNFINA